MSKICVVQVVRDTGGVAKMVIDLSNDLVLKGNKVILYVSNWTDNLLSLLSPEIEVTKITESNFFKPMVFGLGIKKIYDEVKRKNPETKIIIHTHNISTIGLFTNIKKIPILCTIHGISWFGKITLRKKISRRLTSFWIKKKIRKPNIKFIAVSKATADYFSKLIKNIQMDHIHNGVKGNAIKKINDSLVFGFVGDISRAKGWDYVIESLSSISEHKKNNISFISAGRPLDYSPLNINDDLVKIGINERVKYLGVVKDAYLNIMPNIDILLLMSISEGLPMSIIEAQSLGIPVITTDVGGIPEIITHESNGLIVKRDVTDLTNAIDRLIDNKDLRQLMSIRSMENFQSKFTVQMMSEKYMGEYQKIV